MVLAVYKVHQRFANQIKTAVDGTYTKIMHRICFRYESKAFVF